MKTGNRKDTFQIRGSHSGKDVNYVLQGYTLQTDAIHSSEMLITTYKNTWYPNPQDHSQEKGYK